VKVDPPQRSSAAPALAAIPGFRLHMVHLGASTDDLWHSTYDGTNWTPNVKVDPPQRSQAAPALAAMPTVGGGLHMVHLGASTDDLWHSIWS
jgi:hypothetical protein